MGTFLTAGGSLSRAGLGRRLGPTFGQSHASVNELLSEHGPVSSFPRRRLWWLSCDSSKMEWL